MNLYLRFFNDEVLVETVDQAIEFLSRIPEVGIDDSLYNELLRYAEGNNPFPKRFKVNSKAYFIVIKTTATSMEEFKAYAASVGVNDENVAGKAKDAQIYAVEQPGWYQSLIKFKRVLPQEGTGKFQYVDTEFEAKLKAHSVQDCYNRVIDYLRTRADVDPRSQFPSIRGRNFKADFLGI